MGVLARRSGSAKLTRPSPPKVVPSSENSAWFWLIGRSWPLHIAQPFGAKLNDMILSSDRNGSATLFSLGSGARHGDTNRNERLALGARTACAGESAAARCDRVLGEHGRHPADAVVASNEVLNGGVVVVRAAVAGQANGGVGALAKPGVDGAHAAERIRVEPAGEDVVGLDVGADVPRVADTDADVVVDRVLRLRGLRAGR